MSLKGSLDGFNSKVRELKLSIENLNNYENGGGAISSQNEDLRSAYELHKTEERDAETRHKSAQANAAECAKQIKELEAALDFIKKWYNASILNYRNKIHETVFL